MGTGLGGFAQGLSQGWAQGQNIQQEREKIKLQRDYYGGLLKAQDAQTALHGAQTQQILGKIKRDTLLEKMFGGGADASMQAPDEFLEPQSGETLQQEEAPQPAPAAPPLKQGMLGGGEIVPAAFNLPSAPAPKRMDLVQEKPKTRGPLGDPSSFEARFKLGFMLGGPEGAMKVLEQESSRQGKTPPAPLAIDPTKDYVDPSDPNKIIIKGTKKDESSAPKAVSDENRLALSMFKKSFLDLDDAQQERVNKRIQDDRVGIARAGAEVRQQVSQEGLLSAEEANKLGVPFGTTKAQAKGIMSITPQQRESLQGYDTTRAIIADIKQYSEKVNKASGGFKGRAEQAGKLWGAYTQSDPDASLLMSKAGELASVARSLGEKGALANSDVARAAALIPGVTDTAVVATKKLQDMSAIIEKGEANFRKSLGEAGRAPVKEKKSEHKAAAQKSYPAGITTDEQKQKYDAAYQRQQQKMQATP